MHPSIDKGVNIEVVQMYAYEGVIIFEKSRRKKNSIVEKWTRNIIGIFNTRRNIVVKKYMEIG